LRASKSGGRLVKTPAAPTCIVTVQSQPPLEGRAYRRALYHHRRQQRNDFKRRGSRRALCPALVAQAYTQVFR
jgi:hypothetical protein